MANDKSDKRSIDDLPPDVYHVTQERGTETPFSGEYLYNDRHGMYRCVVCGAELFASDAKYDSHCGWPSFFRANDANITLILDDRYGMSRTEISCTSCGAHLGHVFDDGPKQHGGQRYCVNSLSLDFQPSTDEEVAK